jgi:hypothetical protein
MKKHHMMAKDGMAKPAADMPAAAPAPQ